MPQTYDSSIAVSYSLPQNFDAKNPAFAVFKNVKTEILYKPKIKILKNFRVSASSVVFNYFNIVKESCVGQKIYDKYSKGFGFFFKYIFPQFNFSKKRLLLITDEWTTNYYHWHIYALKRLVIFAQEGLLAESMILLPKRYLKCPFVLPSLAKFGITKKQIIFIKKRRHLKAKEIALIEAPHRLPPAIKFCRETLLKNISAEENSGRIYISRNKQKLRFIENENEVEEILSRYGFKKIFCEDLSYEQQISICANARFIVSPHGAGLTNLLFAKENAAILELSGKPDDSKPVTDYYRICNILNLKYFYQLCEFGENSWEKNFHCGSLLVDLATLEENLKLMLKDEPQLFITTRNN